MRVSIDLFDAEFGGISSSNKAPNSSVSSSPAKKKDISKKGASLTWAEKYRPKTPNDIVGNQALVCPLLITLALYSPCSCFCSSTNIEG